MIKKLYTTIIFVIIFTSTQVLKIKGAEPPQLKPAGNTIGSPKPEILENTAGNITSTVTEWLSVLAGVSAFCFIIWFGIKYMASNGDSKKASEARSALINAIIGIAIVIAVGSIIKFSASLGTLIQEAVH